MKESDKKGNIVDVFEGSVDLLSRFMDFGKDYDAMKLLGDKLKICFVANPFYLGLAFSTNELTYSYINKTYDSIEDIAYYVKRHVTEFTYEAISSLNIEMQEITYKTCCIYYYCMDKDDFTLLNNIIKQGYKKLYRYLLGVEGVVDNEIDMLYIKTYGTWLDKEKNVYTKGDLSIYTYHIVCAYFCYFNDKEYVPTNNALYSTIFNMVQILVTTKNEIESIKARDKVPYDFNVFKSEGNKDSGEKSNTYLLDIGAGFENIYSEESTDKLYEKYGIKKGINNLDIIVGCYKDKILIDKLGEEKVKNSNFMELSNNTKFDDPFIVTYVLLIGAMKLAGLIDSTFLNQNLTYEEVTLCLLGVENYRVDNKDATEDDCKRVLAITLVIMNLATQYKKASRLGILKDLQDKSNEASLLIQEYREKLGVLNKQVEEAQTREVQLKNKLDTRESELLRKIAELEKENKILKEDLKDYESIKREVVGLREKVYTESKLEGENELENKSVESMKDYLEDKEIVIIGGNPQWVGKLSKELPHVKFIEFKSISRYLTSLSKLERVYLNVEYFNHPTYYKLMNSLVGTKVKVHYLSGYSNMKRVIEELYSYEMM